MRKLIYSVEELTEEGYQVSNNDEVLTIEESIQNGIMVEYDTNTLKVYKENGNYIADLIKIL